MIPDRKTCLKKMLRRAMGIRLYETCVFRYHLGYWPNFKKPVTFCERLVSRKIFERDERFVYCSDKAAVREYVREKCGTEVLSEVYALVASGSEMPANLPSEFYLKATYGSGINHLIRDYVPARHSEVADLVDNMLRREHTYGRLSTQWWYEQIPKRILVEEVLRDSTNTTVPDYKFYCFHGKAELVHVDYDRFGDHTRSYYDLDWNLLPFTSTYPQGPAGPRPRNLLEMVAVAEALSSEFDFIRVDLYSLDESRIVFGEMTFAPDAGWVVFSPDQKPDWDIGRLWNT